MFSQEKFLNMAVTICLKRYRSLLEKTITSQANVRARICTWPPINCRIKQLMDSKRFHTNSFTKQNLFRKIYNKAATKNQEIKDQHRFQEWFHASQQNYAENTKCCQPKFSELYQEHPTFQLSIKRNEHTKSSKYTILPPKNNRCATRKNSGQYISKHKPENGQAQFLLLKISKDFYSNQPIYDEHSWWYALQQCVWKICNADSKSNHNNLYFHDRPSPPKQSKNLMHDTN